MVGLVSDEEIHRLPFILNLSGLCQPGLITTQVKCMPAPLTFVLFLCVLLCSHNVAYAEADTLVARYSEQRQVFLELIELLQSGENEKAAARRAELNGYPLQEYFEYQLLRKQIELASRPAELLKQVAGFKDDKRLHRRLLGAIKDRSVELSRWQDYKLASSGDNVPVHPCDDLLAGFKNGAPKRFDKTSRDLWVDVGRHTSSCDQAFSMLLASVPDVPTGSLWRRTVALIKRGKLDSARELLKYFNQRDGRVVRAWIEKGDMPHELLPSKVMHGQSEHHREIATLLLRRWARKDLLAASEFWRTGGGRFGFSDKSIQKTLAEHAVLAAKRGLPEASALLAGVDANRDVRYWRVRLALQDGDWKRCVARLDELTDKELEESRWQYWRARCLEAQGFRAASNRIYKSIATEFEYYGFLASDKLQKNYSIDTQASLVSDHELQQLKKSPQIIKAVEYFLAELPWEGRREWNRAMKSSSKARYLASAYLAESVGWHDRALDAANIAGESDALPLLFPQAYASYVGEMATRFGVAQEFVYGVMRQESRFISDIKSPAGAVGLMQLMPGTAKQMGKQLGVKAPQWKLTDSEFNITLGTKYLDHVLSRFDRNIALAAAAYNAGPSRVKKWIAARPLAIDIWVETIPFDETRAYVQKVLFNTVVTEWVIRDGSVTRLNDRLTALPYVSVSAE